MTLKTLRAGLLAAALIALGGLAPAAQAHDSDWGEIRRDRAELRQDYRELARDRAEYARARASGDFRRMHQEGHEIRRDLAEIRRDRAELRQDLRDHRQDRHAPRHAYWQAGVTGNGDNGLHRGWQIGRGNPHRG